MPLNHLPPRKYRQSSCPLSTRPAWAGGGPRSWHTWPRGLSPACRGPAPRPSSSRPRSRWWAGGAELKEVIINKPLLDHIQCINHTGGKTLKSFDCMFCCQPLPYQKDQMKSVTETPQTYWQVPPIFEHISTRQQPWLWWPWNGLN